MSELLEDINTGESLSYIPKREDFKNFTPKSLGKADICLKMQVFSLRGMKFKENFNIGKSKKTSLSCRTLSTYGDSNV